MLAGRTTCYPGLSNGNCNPDYSTMWLKRAGFRAVSPSVWNNFTNKYSFLKTLSDGQGGTWANMYNDGGHESEETWRIIVVEKSGQKLKPNQSLVKGQVFSANNLSINSTVITNNHSVLKANNDISLEGATLNNIGSALQETLLFKLRTYKCHGCSGQSALRNVRTYSKSISTGSSYSVIDAGNNLFGNLIAFVNTSSKKSIAIDESANIDNFKSDSKIQESTLQNVHNESVKTKSLEPNINILNNRKISNSEINNNDLSLLSTISNNGEVNKNVILKQTNLSNSPIDKKIFILNGKEFKLPKNKYGIFTTSPKIPNQKYLIESNPLYTAKNTLIGSDYFFKRLGVNLNRKRLGDARFENQLVMNSILEKTGILRGKNIDDNTEYLRLMDNTLNVFSSLNLDLTSTPTKEQLENLKEDIVWLEERVVNDEIVLVPVVYLAKDYRTTASIKAGGKIDLNIKEKVVNSGEIKAVGDVKIVSKNITNDSGIVESKANIELTSQNDLINKNGSTISGENITLKSTQGSVINDRYHEKVKEGTTNRTFTYTLVGKKSSIEAKNDLKIEAKNNIENLASNISAERSLYLKALNGKVDFKTKEVEASYKFVRNSSNYSKGKQLKHEEATVTAGKNLQIDAGKDINIEASNLYAKNQIMLNAKNDVNITAVNELDYTDVKTHMKKSWGRSSTERNMSYKEKVRQSNLEGENIIITSQKNIKLEASNLKAKENIIVEAKKDINVTAKQYREGELHYKAKKGFGGLNSSASMNRNDALNLREAKLTTEAKNIILKSQNDIKVIASQLDAAGDIELNAVNELLITAANEYKKEEKWSKKSSFSIAGVLSIIGIEVVPVYKKEFKLDESAKKSIKSSSVKSGGNLKIDAGNAKVVGSDISASKDITAKTDVGSIEVLSAEETLNTRKFEKKIEVQLANLTDLTKSIHGLGQKLGETKLKITLAKATYDKENNTLNQVTNKSSNVKSDENIILDSIENINIKGSNVEAKKDLTLKAEQDINIKEATNTTGTTNKETHAKAEINLTIQNEYVEAAKAYVEVAQAVKQVNKARKDYKNTEYKSKVPGVSKEDVDDLSEIISDIKSDEKYYIASVAASVANLVSKKTLAVQQTAAAASSAATYGFSAGLSFDVNGSKIKSESNKTTAIASNIKANNILIETKTDKNNKTTISGSNVKANEDLNINTKDLDIISSVNTSNSKSDSKDINGSVSMTVYGASSGPQVSLGYGEQHNALDSLKNTNSKVEANNINITTSNDTNIKGANVKADDTLTLNVGNDLNIESQRDTHNSNSKGFNISAGFGLGTDSKLANTEVGLRTSNGEVTSANGGFGANKGRVKVKETVVTTVTGDKVDINVGNNTNLKGSVLASGKYDENGKLIDNENLKVNTKTLTYQDSSNVVYDTSNSFNIGENIGVGKTSKDSTTDSKDGTKINSSNFKYSNNKTYSKTKTLATLGKGEVNISDKENSDDTTALNRDTQNTKKDIYDVSTGVKIDMTLDHRLLTEDGQKDIKKDFAKSKKIIDTIDKIVKTDDITVSDFFKELEKSSVMQDVIQKIIENNPKLAETLSKDSTASITENKDAMKIMAMAVLSEHGYSLNKIKFINTDEKGQGQKDIKGFVTTENDNIYLNLKNINNVSNMIRTLGQELAGYTQKKEGIDITTNREEHNKYQDMVSKDLINDVEFALENSKNTTINKKPLIVKVNSIEEYLELQRNNEEFASLDKEKGDNLTVFVHGTYASPKSADKDFIKYIEKTYGESVFQFDWSGENGTANGYGAENNTYARANAAWRLAQYIENYKFKNNEPLNIIMHSHGTNVGRAFSQFYEGKKKIDSFIMLAGPVRDDYKIDYSKFSKDAKIVNVYDSSDLVQRLGGTDTPDFLKKPYIFVNFGKIGIAKQQIDNPKVKNIKVEVPNNNFYDGPFGDHSNMDSKEVMEKIQNEIK